MKAFEFDFIILGGDNRQIYLQELLVQQGYRVESIGLSDREENADSYQKLITQSACVVGAIPFLKNGRALYLPDKDISLSLNELQTMLQAGQKLAAGCIPFAMKEFCNNNKIAYFDFMDDAPLTLYNTIATAEGAIVEAIQKSPLNLCNQKSLVLGFGKCAQTLANRLTGLQSYVTVAARKEDARMLSETMGYQSIYFEQLGFHINQYDFIFNTVPDLVLDAELLKNVSKQAIIIDIASVPGGVDYSFAKKNNIPAFLCLGLPGKYAPKASAEKIAERLILFFSDSFDILRR